MCLMPCYQRKRLKWTFRALKMTGPHWQCQRRLIPTINEFQYNRTYLSCLPVISFPVFILQPPKWVLRHLLFTKGLQINFILHQYYVCIFFETLYVRRWTGRFIFQLYSHSNLSINCILFYFSNFQCFIWSFPWIILVLSKATTPLLLPGQSWRWNRICRCWFQSRRHSNATISQQPSTINDICSSRRRGFSSWLLTFSSYAWSFNRSPLWIWCGTDSNRRPRSYIR